MMMSVIIALSMMLAACQPAAAPTEAPAAVEPTAAPEQPSAVEGLPPAGPELAEAFAGKYKGTVVTMDGPFATADAVKFDNSVKEFEDKTGIDIQYGGGKEFEATISIRIDGGNPPDIADFPQPGLLNTQVKKGKVIDLNKVISQEWLKQNFKQAWLDMAVMEAPDGPIMAGVWNRVNGKSLVWYPKKEFDAAGYKIPTTWDELMALTEQIANDGDTPWCIGIESGAATGWPMTDWIEDLMLRTTSLENYDKWVKGELKFDSPEVRNAIDYVSKIWFNDKYVYGGRQAIVTSNFGSDAPQPMFDKPPKCWMHRQGSFITTFFPEGLTPGVDYDFFYLPPIGTELGRPALVAGDIYAMFNDRPEVRAVIQWFSTAQSLKGWIEAGGAISPANDQNLDWYGSNVIDKGVAELIQNATAVRFDGSDQMPGAVGSGSFWKSMTSYVSGSIDLDTALQEIDASWPK
jgi:alpha-glucoside transport system substrate-binding protein